METSPAHDQTGSDQESHFEVTVLGLGAMGAAMAEAFVASGKRVAVWNRSRSKAERLEAHSAHVCETATEALLASPVSILGFSTTMR